MYSPYGSYSSMSSVTQPMDISTNSYLSYNSAYHASCAFPSWPQRSSLTESTREERATSYLSDDDLFPCDSSEDDAHSVSSSGSAPTSPFANDEDVLKMQREKMAMQQEAMRFLLNEKERRRQQLKRSRRSSSGSKKSPKSKPDHMASITETGE